MKSVSIAVLVSALAFSTFAVGAGVSTNVRGTVNSATNAATGNGSTNAATNASGQVNADASASAGGVTVGASTSTEVGAGASTSASAPGTSSALSSVSSVLSSTESSLVSGESSLLGTSSMNASMACDQVNSTGVSIGAIDAAALAAVTSVTVFSVADCSGLPSGTLDGGAAAALAGNAKVADAIKAAGDAGDIVGYHLDGTSLTVYVKQ